MNSPQRASPCRALSLRGTPLEIDAGLIYRVARVHTTREKGVKGPKNAANTLNRLGWPFPLLLCCARFFAFDWDIL